jgi:uncharacterized protein YkwD
MPSNNQLTTAKKILPAGEGTSTYAGRVGSENTNRYYKFNVGRASSLNLSLGRLKSNANLELLDQAGNLLSRSARKGRAKETIQQSLEPGTYYVRVLRHRGSTRYRLKLSVTAQQTSPGASTHPFVQQVLDLTNVQRQQAGLASLTLNQNLNASAQAHTNDMAFNDFFAHTGSNGSSFADRVRSAGYNYSFTAENIAAGYATPSSVVKAWMNSSGHRANILNPNLRELGVGFYFLENDPGTTTYRYYWTQNFGTSS